MLDMAGKPRTAANHSGISTEYVMTICQLTGMIVNVFVCVNGQVEENFFPVMLARLARTLLPDFVLDLNQS